MALARKIVPQKMSTQEVRQLLGEPDSIYPLEADPRDVWIYFRSKEPANRRLDIFIDRKAGIVQSVTWNVFEEDPEINLEYVKNALGNPKLIKNEPKWLSGDAAPDEIYYRSEQLRLLITVRKTLNQVDMISWH